MDKFVTQPFECESLRWIEFEKEITLNLQANNPTALQFLFPEVPWVLDANNIPETLPIELTEYDNPMPVNANIPPAERESAWEAYKAMKLHNVETKLMMSNLRQLIVARVGVSLTEKIRQCKDNYQLYHFWSEIKRLHGYNTTSKSTKATQQVNALGKKQHSKESFNRWINTLEVEWDRYQFPDLLKQGLLISDGANLSGIKLITDERLAKAVQDCRDSATFNYVDCKNHILSAANQLMSSEPDTTTATNTKTTTAKVKAVVPNSVFFFQK